MRIAAEGAAEMGLVPYYLYRQKNMSGNFENVGYARPAVGDRPARYGIYNILIMEEKQTILACGAGTSTKVVVPDGEGKPGGRTIARCFDPRDLRTYLEHVEACVQRKRELLEKMGRLDAGRRALP